MTIFSQSRHYVNTTICVLITTTLLLGACASKQRVANTSEPVAETVEVTSSPAPVVPAPTSRPGGPIIISVPKDQKTIQLAVDRSAPGDLILVAAGVYNEEVIIRTPNIVVRGVDRNTVILDGNDELSNGFQVSANHVAVENLTVKRYTVNGIVFTKAYDAVDPTKAEVLQGYRASYVTVANNGLYGLYAFYAAGGQFDHVYGSGHPDGGIYIGQCKPCNAVVKDAVMENNGLGYSGTNSSGELYLINSVYRGNRIGMSPNSQTMETLSPQGDAVIAGNLVENNDNPAAPPAASGAFGFGIAVGGGERNQILRNRVRGNDNVGIAVTTLNEFSPSGNWVEGNVLSDNGTDLAFYASGALELPASGGCFTGNTFESSEPADIEGKLLCDSPTDKIQSDGSRFAKSGPEGVDYRKIALPAPQPNMPDALTAPAVPASSAVPKIDLATIKVPSQ
jgi:Right handed beta helix region